MCGTAEWEWEEDKRAYAPVEHFCMGCYMKAIQGEGAESAPGVTIHLAPTDTVEHARRLVREKKQAMKR